MHGTNGEHAAPSCRQPPAVPWVCPAHRPAPASIRAKDTLSSTVLRLFRHPPRHRALHVFPVSHVQTESAAGLSTPPLPQFARHCWSTVAL